MDSDTCITAMNSKWSAKTQKVVEIAFGSDAAARLKFGESPFVLKTGENALPENNKKKAPPKITSSNLHPNQKGGIDVDDLHSVSGESHARTVYRGKVSDDEDDEYEDDEEFNDDVSRMGDDEGFESDDDEETKFEGDDDEEMDSDESGDESTRSGYKRRDDDDEDSVASYDDEDDEYTKVDLDELQKKGRKIRKDADESAELKRLREYTAAQEKSMEQMRRDFEEKLKKMEEEKNAPGVSNGTGAGVDNSGNGSVGDAPAGD